MLVSCTSITAAFTVSAAAKTIRSLLLSPLPSAARDIGPTMLIFLFLGLELDGFSLYSPSSSSSSLLSSSRESCCWNGLSFPHHTECRQTNWEALTPFWVTWTGGETCWDICRDPVPAPKLGPGFKFPWLLVTVDFSCSIENPSNYCNLKIHIIPGWLVHYHYPPPGSVSPQVWGSPPPSDGSTDYL